MTNPKDAALRAAALAIPRCSKWGFSGCPPEEREPCDGCVARRLIDAALDASPADGGLALDDYCATCKGTKRVRRTRSAGGGRIGSQTWEEDCPDCKAREIDAAPASPGGEGVPDWRPIFRALYRATLREAARLISLDETYREDGWGGMVTTSRDAFIQQARERLGVSHDLVLDLVRGNSSAFSIANEERGRVGEFTTPAPPQGEALRSAALAMLEDAGPMPEMAGRVLVSADKLRDLIIAALAQEEKRDDE